MLYRAEIDGLRALAVIPVIFFHAGIESFSGGYVGVDVFFVISGYLITTIILADLEQGRFSIVHFYERRVRRILPALFFVMFCSLPLAWYLFLPSDMKDFSQSLAAVSTFSSNILFWRESDYFAGAAELKPLLHTWSLAIEEQYYVLFPLFLLVLWRVEKRWIAGAVLLVLVTSLWVAHWGAYYAPTANFFLLPSRAWELAIGALVALFLFNSDYKAFQPPASGLIGEAGGLAGLALIVYSIVIFDERTPFPGLYALVPTLGTALIIVFATGKSVAGKLLSARPIVAVGLVSYSAYLWHQPLLAFARYGWPDMAQMLLITVCAVSLGLAALSWRFVEKPFRDRDLMSRRTVFMFGAIGSVFFLTVGALGTWTDGFINRYEPRLHSLLKVDHNPRYVPLIGSRIAGVDFATNEKIKILVVGDSYAEDLINAIYENGLDEQLELSFHKIFAGCGNLYLDEDFSEHIPPRKLSYCRKTGWYEKSGVRDRIERSDVIWLASAWTDWETELIPRSVENLISDYGDKVLVFGTKHFGRMNLRQIVLAAQSQEISDLHNRPLDERIHINERMKNSAYASRFVDLMDLLCGAAYRCPVTDAKGKLLSFDGGHLTREGAIYLGSLLRDHPAIRAIIEESDSVRSRD